MAKVKYLFSHETLSYVKVEINWFKRILAQLAPAFVIAVILFFAVTYFFDSPRVRGLKRENRVLINQYEYLNERLTFLNKVLDDVKQRDDNIYRAIFETEPVPASVRYGGIGGADRYAIFNGFDNSEIIINTTRKLDNVTKQLVVQSRSFDDVTKLVKTKKELLQSIPAIQPISNIDLKHMPYGYGPRIDPIYKTPAFHDGLDFAAPIGTDVYATGDGSVAENDLQKGGLGKMIMIDHGFGYTTTYAHLSEIFVKIGQKVKRGQLIGAVGNTGKSTGAHLHYSVHKDGKSLNPINYFFNDLSAEQYDHMVKLATTSGQAMD